MNSSDATRAARLAETIAGDFYNDRLDLSTRGVESGTTWQSLMPEVECVMRLRDFGVSDREVRLFLTFVAAMDRARDATRLWNNGTRLLISRPDLFDPSVVSEIPVSELSKTLSKFGVSQRHGPDSDAWYVIARTLASGESPVRRAIDDGIGDAEELRRDLQRKDTQGYPRFPLLRGPKIGQMWVRMLAVPGSAKIANIDIISVAVDVHVRRVTENLGVSDTRGMSLDEARPVIQSVWRAAVAETNIGGPAGIANTCAALDQALWVIGKHGCSHCEKVGRQMPISSACDQCQFRKSS